MVLIKQFSIDLFTEKHYFDDDDFLYGDLRQFFWGMLRQIADSGTCNDLATGMYFGDLPEKIPRLKLFEKNFENFLEIQEN